LKKNPDSAEDATLIIEKDTMISAGSFSSDGRWFVFSKRDSDGRTQIWLSSTETDDEPLQYTHVEGGGAYLDTIQSGTDV
jgi:Tol biopolymer transport system component